MAKLTKTVIFFCEKSELNLKDNRLCDDLFRSIGKAILNNGEEVKKQFFPGGAVKVSFELFKGFIGDRLPRVIDIYHFRGIDRRMILKFN